MCSQAGHLDKRQKGKKTERERTSTDLIIQRMIPCWQQLVNAADSRYLAKEGMSLILCFLSRLLLVPVYTMQKEEKKSKRVRFSFLHAVSYYCCDIYTNIFTSSSERNNVFPWNSVGSSLVIVLNSLLWPLDNKSIGFPPSSCWHCLTYIKNWFIIWLESKIER